MSERILALLALAEECPELDDLAGYLSDDDAEVRRTALSVLSEATEEWDEASPVIAAALADPDIAVRRTAIDLLGELREVLVPTEPFGRALRVAASHQEPDVRVVAIATLWRRGLSTADELTSWLADPDDEVRCEVIQGLVSLDAMELLVTAVPDPSPAVRIAVARGIGAVADPRGVTSLVALAGDVDPLVRAAALAAMADTGCTDGATDLAVHAIADVAWQVREGAAVALSASQRGDAVDALIVATRDENLDVRKAAVRALAARSSHHPDVQAALDFALTDVDADVRAFARLGAGSASANGMPRDA